ncbi:MAG: hypothetical protein KU28_01330 [Sulfurovum sp. PC08-66]|nr:MAG: hypothetical protein KU28_01330 [Sulfurovum sp. PC08-66]KIM12593.1 MAG: hypothetical protein KU37_01445 [Sulfuricurvum sp. PC08-66]
MTITLLGRQPIFDRQNQVTFYRLTYRNRPKNDKIPAQALADFAHNFDTLMHAIGINAALEDKRGWVKISDQILTKTDLTLLPASKLIFEIEAQVFSIKLSQIIQEYAEQGYVFALNEALVEDVIAKCGEAYLALFEYVTFNIRKLDIAHYHAHNKLFDELAIKRVATHVETKRGLEIALEMGFDYVCGSFFKEATVIKGKQLSPHQTTYLQLISLLNNPESTPDIVTLFKHAPSESLQLLSYINSAGLATNKTINNIEQAVKLLGPKRLRAWANMMLLACEEGNFNELLLDTSLMRAYMMERLAHILHRDALMDEAYLVGMLSLADTILALPMQTLVEKIHLGESVAKALALGEGELGKILHIVKAIERGNFRQIEIFSRRLNIPFESIHILLKEAFVYVRTTKSQLSTTKESTKKA